MENIDRQTGYMNMVYISIIHYNKYVCMLRKEFFFCCIESISFAYSIFLLRWRSVSVTMSMYNYNEPNSIRLPGGFFYHIFIFTPSQTEALMYNILCYPKFQFSYIQRLP